jgi:hypothetical protein
VTADGHPLLIEVERIDRLFEENTPWWRTCRHEQ